MAIHRIKKTFICLAAICTVRVALGCGGWDEEEPDTLDHTLPALPAKSLGEILTETTPATGKPQEIDFAAEIGKIGERIGKDKPADLAKAVDDLLNKARVNYHDDAWCNLLEDARDVVTASSQNADAARGYLRWRLQHMEWFKPPAVDPAVWPPPPPPQ